MVQGNKNPKLERGEGESKIIVFASTLPSGIPRSLCKIGVSKQLHFIFAVVLHSMKHTEFEYKGLKATLLRNICTGSMYTVTPES